MAAPAVNPLFAAGLVFSASAYVLKPYREGKRARSYTLAENAPESVRKILEKCSALAHMKERMFLASLDNFSLSQPEGTRAFFQNHLVENFQLQFLAETTKTLRELATLVNESVQNPECPAAQNLQLRQALPRIMRLFPSS